MDSNSPSISTSSTVPSVRSQVSTESVQESSTERTHPPNWHRSSSQPATLRNGAFNEISDGNWEYCIETPNAQQVYMKGFRNQALPTYEDIEAMGGPKLKICTLTWNVNEKPGKVLNHLAQKIKERSQEMDSDIVFISLQEIPSTSSTFHEEARRILEPILTGHRLYLSYRAWSQMVIVFIKNKHIRYATQPQITFVASGAMAKPVRTKGAIAVFLRLYQRFIVLIGCHLSHATPQLRVQDYAKVVRTLRFPTLPKFNPNASDRLFGCDVVLWVGDLNFRVTVENNVDWSDPEKIQEKVFNAILETEEFASHKKKKEAFADFIEAPVRFPPTHKFEPDTDTYVPKRIPSFTDRVLYWAKNSEWLQPIEYDCMRGASPSDHRAVFATFWITVINKPVPDAYRQMKSLENGSIKSSDATDQAKQQI